MLCRRTHDHQKEGWLKAVVDLLTAAQGGGRHRHRLPMCQMNWIVSRNRLRSGCGEVLAMSVLYLPQLMGLAMGLSHTAVGSVKTWRLVETFRAKVA